MLRWCQQFLEENQCAWARRKRTEMEEKEALEKHMELDNLPGEEIVAELIRRKGEEEKLKESKKERAQRRKGYWKEWRKGREEEKDVEEGFINNDLTEIAQGPDLVDRKDGRNSEDIIKKKTQAEEMRKKRKTWKSEKSSKNSVVRKIEMKMKGNWERFPLLDSKVPGPPLNKGEIVGEEGPSPHPPLTILGGGESIQSWKKSEAEEEEEIDMMLGDWQEKLCMQCVSV